MALDYREVLRAEVVFLPRPAEDAFLGPRLIVADFFGPRDAEVDFLAPREAAAFLATRFFFAASIELRFSKGTRGERFSETSYRSLRAGFS
jgi:hypothetical protein